MARKIKRRKFILAMLLSGLSLYVGGWWIFKVRKKDASDIVATIIRKRLHFLKIDDSEIDAFINNFQKKMPQSWRYYASWVGILTPVCSFADIFKLAPTSGGFRNFEEYTVMQFLLSSDFFWRGADESRPVKYREYYDLREIVCDNPFAVID